MLKHLWRVENNKELVLNLREILKYNELAIIYTRDKTNGKMQALNEFRYIDFFANRESFPIVSGFNEKETHNFAIKHSYLPDSYKPDESVKKAIKKAKELNAGVIENMIDTIVIALRISSKLATHAKDLLDDMESKIKTPEDIREAMKLTDVVVDLANTVPVKIKKLLELRAEYDKQESKSLNAKRGGGELTASLEGGGFEQSDDSGQVETLD